jgi:hypothetical protein
MAARAVPPKNLRRLAPTLPSPLAALFCAMIVLSLVVFLAGFTGA